MFGECFTSVCRVNHEQIAREAFPENFEQAKLFWRVPRVSKSKSREAKSVLRVLWEFCKYDQVWTKYSLFT